MPETQIKFLSFILPWELSPVRACHIPLKNVIIVPICLIMVIIQWVSKRPNVKLTYIIVLKLDPEFSYEIIFNLIEIINSTKKLPSS
jgi:hypothetical protein